MKKWLILLIIAGGGVYGLYTDYMKTSSDVLAPNLGQYLQESVVIQQDNKDSNRNFNYYLPEELTENPALIFVLHGSKGTGDKIRFQSGYQFDYQAQKSGDFIVVYPDGYQNHWNGCRASVSYSANTQNINDPAFFTEMISYFAKYHKVNKERIFAAGFSNGGHMVYRLGFEMPEQFSGLAVMAANLPVDENFDCHKKNQAVSIAIFNGSQDPINPNDGGLVEIFGDKSRGSVIASRASARYWAALGHLEDSSEITLPNFDNNNETSIVKTTWTDTKKAKSMQVRLYTLKGSGHVMPSKVVDFAKILGGNAQDIEAAEEVWDFFQLIDEQQKLPEKPEPVGELSPGVLQGYLPLTALPNGLTLIPLPPEIGSTALAHDKEINQAMLELKGTERWHLAISDADLKFPHAAGAFSCAMNVEITEQDMPNLYMLLRRSATDAGLSTFMAKKKYQRARPFMINNQATCDQKKEKHLRTSGAYPSGHSAIGWAWALILSELLPEKSDAILARGRAFAQSRAVCNVHWQSDIANGSIIGAAAYSKLHSSELFQSAIAAAKIELAIARKQGNKSTIDCKSEAKALAL